MLSLIKGKWPLEDAIVPLNFLFELVPKHLFPINLSYKLLSARQHSGF
jgi:hypothetical protein